MLHNDPQHLTVYHRRQHFNSTKRHAMYWSLPSPCLSLRVTLTHTVTYHVTQHSPPPSVQQLKRDCVKIRHIITKHKITLQQQWQVMYSLSLADKVNSASAWVTTVGPNGMPNYWQGLINLYFVYRFQTCWCRDLHTLWSTVTTNLTESTRTFFLSYSQYFLLSNID